MHQILWRLPSVMDWQLLFTENLSQAKTFLLHNSVGHFWHMFGSIFHHSFDIINLSHILWIPHLTTILKKGFGTWLHILNIQWISILKCPAANTLHPFKCITHHFRQFAGMHYKSRARWHAEVLNLELYLGSKLVAMQPHLYLYCRFFLPILFHVAYQGFLYSFLQPYLRQ